MVEILLTPEQSSVLSQATGPIVLVDGQGHALGQVAPVATSRHFTAEEIAAIESRSGKDGPYITTAELLKRLESGESKCDSP